MGQKQKRIRVDRKSTRTSQKNKRGDIEKWDQTESPEIPDRGRHQKSPASLEELKHTHMMYYKFKQVL